MSDSTDPLFPPGTGDALVHIEIAHLGRLWTQNPTLAEGVTSLYGALAGDLRDDHGGQAVAVSTDGSLLVFASVDTALMWCIRMQEALLSAGWPDGLDQEMPPPSPGLETVTGGLRTQMGIHLGQADSWIDRARVARLASLTQPGQVLITEAAWSAAEMPSREGGVVIRDIGEAVLHEGDRAMPIVQVLPRSLARRRFDTLQTTLVPRSNLTRSNPAFVGRTADTEALEERFTAGGRLVSVVGPSGMGKTRLAREFAHLHRSDHPGGVWMIRLSRCRSPSDVLWAAATTFGISHQAGGLAIIERIGQALRGLGRALILLDGVNIEGAASAIGTWVRGAPEARFIVTTRRPLDLEWETLQHLNPLSPRDASSLLSARIKQIQPRGGATPTQEERERLAYLTGGAPLAIVLVASHLASTAPSTVIDALEAQQTGDEPPCLDAVVAAVWEQLHERQRQILHVAATHPGDIDAQALIATMEHANSPDPTHQPRHCLEQLLAWGVVEWSPIASSAPTVILTDAVRDHARQHAAEAGSIQAQITEQLLQTIASGTAHIDVPTLRELYTQTQQEDPQQAARLALGIHRGLTDRGLAFEDMQMLDTGICAAQDSSDTELELSLRLSRAQVSRSGSNWDAASDDLKAALKLSSDLDLQLQAAAKRAMGAWHRDRGDNEQALHVLIEARTVLEEAGEQDPGLLGDLGALYRSMDRFEEAVGVLEAASQLCTDRSRRCQVLIELGRAHLSIGRVDPAARSFERAMEDAEAAQDLRLQAINRSLQAEVALLQGRADTAAILYGQNVDALTTTGYRALLAEVRANLGDLHLSRDALDEATLEYGHALALCHELGLPTIEAHVLAHLGVTARAQGDIDGALDKLAGAAALARAQGNAQLETFVLAHRGAVEAAWDRLDAAQLEFTAAKERSEADGDPMAQVILDVLAGFMDLAHARDAAASDREDEAQSQVQNALARLARGASHESRVAPPRGNETPSRLADLRVALRLLDSALANVVPREIPPT